MGDKLKREYNIDLLKDVIMQILPPMSAAIPELRGGLDLIIVRSY